MGKRILIVDDEITTLQAYKKLLQKPGIEVDTAETLEEAENLMRKESYHVIITDLRLNGENKEGGFEILRCVDKYYPETKAILITAHGNPALKEKAHTLGASFYFMVIELAPQLSFPHKRKSSFHSHLQVLLF